MRNSSPSGKGLFAKQGRGRGNDGYVSTGWFLKLWRSYFDLLREPKPLGPSLRRGGGAHTCGAVLTKKSAKLRHRYKRAFVCQFAFVPQRPSHSTSPALFTAISLFVSLFGVTAAIGQTNPASSSAPKLATRTSIEQCILIGARLSVPTDPVCDRLPASSVLGNSHRGDAIHGFSLGETPEKASARVLVLGAIHGDETSAAWLPLLWVADGLHEKAKKEKLAVLVVPIMNPDNALARTIKRTNARDVDVNRNFPTANWAEESVKWWTQTTKRDPRRFPGKDAASEAETKLIMREMDRFKPNAIISVHAPYNVLDFDGRNVPAPQRIGSLRLDAVGIYPGSLGNYAAMVRGIPVVTLELPSAMRATSQAEAATMWGDFSKWLKTNAKLVKAVSANAGPEKK
jgi:murein peptide amidase A